MLHGPFVDMHLHAEGFSLSNYRMLSTPHFVQVYLPSVSVQLAFVLCHVHELQDGVADDACLIQVPDGEVVLAIHTISQQVIFFSCDSSGNVRKRPETLADISCVSSLDMSASSSSTAGDPFCPAFI